MTYKHEMKSWSHLFQAMKLGVKKHDIRNKNERDFQVGDICKLNEWDNINGKYTGDYILVQITYITSKDHVACAYSSAVLEDDYCILSVDRIDE